MESFNDNIIEYRKQLEKGAIQKGYRGLMEYIMGLRTYFSNKYPDNHVSGSIYQGHMDMTFFALSPKSLKDRNLKVVILFIHDTFRFEAWLAGVNKQVQTRYWKLFERKRMGKISRARNDEGERSDRHAHPG